MIYTIDFNDNIIELFVEFLLKETNKTISSNDWSKKEKIDFSSTIIVTPGKRPQFYLRKSLSERIKKPFFPPSIFSIEEFIQFLTQRNIDNKLSIDSFQPISEIDACFLIHKIVRNLKLSYLNWQKQLEFERFFLWARKIFQFLEELDKELISERQLLDIQENAQIGLPLPEYINQLLENISRVHKEFHQLLDTNNLTTLGYNYYRIAHSIGEIPLEGISSIYFLGFFALNACEKKIVKYLMEQRLAVLFWQRDKDRWPIFEELEQYFAVKPQILKRDTSIVNDNSPEIQIYEGFDTHSQVEAVRRILSKIKELDNTCIVLSNSEALMPLIYQALPFELTESNISLGYPLKRTAIYTLIDTIMQTHQRRRRDGSFYSKDYLKIMMHPYIKNIGDDNISSDATRILVHKIEEVLLGIEKRIAGDQRPFVNLKDIEDNYFLFEVVSSVIHAFHNIQIEPERLQTHLRRIHKTFFSPFDSCVTFIDFVEAVRGFIYFILKKSNVSSDLFSGEIFKRLLEILDVFGQSLFKNEPLNEKSVFFELFKSCLFFENIPFSGTPVRGLQILGLLETRNLKFKNVIFLDLNEGVLPKAEKGSSFIPEGVFPVLGLPHYHKKEQIMRYHFRRLLQAAENGFLIYSVCSKNSESRSRFIEEIIWEDEKDNKKIYDPARIKRIEFKVVPVKAGFEIKKTGQVVSIIKGMIFSPSSLDTYLRCPAKFYFRYCLGLKEKEEFSDGVEASDIGNFLHSLLRDFYSMFLNREVKLDEHARSYLFELNKKKIKEFFPQDTGEQFLVSKIIEYKLNMFFKQEKKREEAIKILYLEQVFPFMAERIKIDTEFGPLYLKGKIDRIDERIYNNLKQVVILDYKTGEYALPKKNITGSILSTREEIKNAIGSFQIPVYLFLFRESMKLVSWKGLDAGCYSLRDVKEELLFGKDNAEYEVEAYIDALKTILSEIFCPDIGFVRDDLDEFYCQWCSFSGLCKR